MSTVTSRTSPSSLPACLPEPEVSPGATSTLAATPVKAGAVPSSRTGVEEYRENDVHQGLAGRALERTYAQALGIRVDEITVDAEGDLDARRLFGLDETVRAGFTDVRLAITITGPESEDRYQALREAVDAHCPVLDLFQNPTPVSVTVAKA